MIAIRPYRPVDDAALIDLCSMPVSGDLVLALERSPSYLAGSKLQTLKPAVYVCEVEQGGVVGVFNIGTRPAYLAGNIIDIHYLCDLRVHPDFQNGSLFLRIMRFIGSLNLNWNEVPALSVVFADNHLMVDMIQKRYSIQMHGIPYYHQIATISSFLFSSSNGFKCLSGLVIRKARREDLAEMNRMRMEEYQALTYAPYEAIIDQETDYNRGLRIEDYFILHPEGDPSNIQAFAALWNTSAIKNTRIVRYPFYLKLLKAITPMIPFVAWPVLPEEGHFLRSTYVHNLVVKNRDKQLFSSLMQLICRSFTRGQNLLCTLDQRDPLFPVLVAKKMAVEKQGFVYLVNYEKTLYKAMSGRYFLLDVARI